MKSCASAYPPPRLFPPLFSPQVTPKEEHSGGFDSPRSVGCVPPSFLRCGQAIVIVYDVGSVPTTQKTNGGFYHSLFCSARVWHEIPFLSLLPSFLCAVCPLQKVRYGQLEFSSLLSSSPTTRSVSPPKEYRAGNFSSVLIFSNHPSTRTQVH